MTALLLASPLARTALGGLAIALLLGGAYFWIHAKGASDERRNNAVDVLEERERSRKLREQNDADARRLDDDAALGCLRDPAGCRR